MENTDDNLPAQMIKDPARRGALLDLTLTNKERLIGDVKVKGCLGCSDQEMVEFRILRRENNAKSRITTLDFRRADFGLFRHLPERYAGNKVKTRENAVLLLNWKGSLVTYDTEKAKVLNDFFASVLAIEICLWESEAPKESESD